jgi:ferredoxin
MVPQLSGSISSVVTSMPGVTVSVTDACTGCGRCVELCLSSAIDLEIELPDYFERSIRTIEPLVDVEKE